MNHNVGFPQWFIPPNPPIYGDLGDGLLLAFPMSLAPLAWQWVKTWCPWEKSIKIAGICGCSSPQNLRWWSMIYWSLLIHSWVKFTVPYLEMFLSPEWWTLATIHGPPGAGVSAAGDETMKLKQPRLEKQHWVTGRQPWQPRNRYLTYLK